MCKWDDNINVDLKDTRFVSSLNSYTITQE